MIKARKSILLVLFWVVGVGIVCVVGCGKFREERVYSTKALIVPEKDYDVVWDEVIDVLREHYFVPEREDRNAGLIVTYPSISSQWFEFWRDDVLSGFDRTESSLHTIRRIVEIKFKSIGGKKLKITANVYVQRKETNVWADLGKDDKLASYLLDKISRRLPEVEIVESD